MLGTNLDATFKGLITARLEELEKHLKADCIFYYGPIYLGINFDAIFKDFIERIAEEKNIIKKFAFF